MRSMPIVRPILFVLALGVVAAIFLQVSARNRRRADLAAAPDAVASEPIPQDAARMERRSHERLEWARATLGAGYERVGKKDPRWDGPAREALDLAARAFSLQDDP